MTNKNINSNRFVFTCDFLESFQIKSIEPFWVQSSSIDTKAMMVSIDYFLTENGTNKQIFQHLQNKTESKAKLNWLSKTGKVVETWELEGVRVKNLCFKEALDYDAIHDKPLVMTCTLRVAGINIV